MAAGPRCGCVPSRCLAYTTMSSAVGRAADKLPPPTMFSLDPLVSGLLKVLLALSTGVSRSGGGPGWSLEMVSPPGPLHFVVRSADARTRSVTSSHPRKYSALLLV